MLFDKHRRRFEKCVDHGRAGRIGRSQLRSWRRGCDTAQHFHSSLPSRKFIRLEHPCPECQCTPDSKCELLHISVDALGQSFNLRGQSEPLFTMPRLIRSACLTGYVEVAHRFGLAPFFLLKEASLDRSCLLDPDIKISLTSVTGCWRRRRARRESKISASECPKTAAFQTLVPSRWQRAMQVAFAKWSTRWPAICACTPMFLCCSLRKVMI